MRGTANEILHMLQQVQAACKEQEPKKPVRPSKLNREEILGKELAQTINELEKTTRYNSKNTDDVIKQALSAERNRLAQPPRGATMLTHRLFAPKTAFLRQLSTLADCQQYMLQYLMTIKARLNTAPLLAQLCQNLLFLDMATVPDRVLMLMRVLKAFRILLRLAQSVKSRLIATWWTI